VFTLGGQLQAGEVTVRFASRIVGTHRRFPRKRREHGQGEERHPPVDRQWARAVTGIGAALVVTILCVAGCADSAAICSQAGGEYANGACTLSGSSQLAVQQWCETNGGVHLAGPNLCGYGRPLSLLPTSASGHPDGRDGTTHLLLEPPESLEKLAALTPTARSASAPLPRRARSARCLAKA